MARAIPGVAATLALGMSAHAAPLSCDRPIYGTGFESDIMIGSKSDLIRAAETGRSLRIGWQHDIDGDGVGDLTHWSDAVFITIFENEVATQVQSIHRQRPIRNEGHTILTDEAQTWSGIIGSDGWMQGRMMPGDVGDRRQVATLWCDTDAAPPQSPSWSVAYRSGLNGEALDGSIDRLLDAIRAGQPIRVGWGLSRRGEEGTRSVEHVIDPVFMTIVDAQHVVAQLPEHIAQQSYWRVEDSLFDTGSVMWRGVISTNGTFDAIWVDRASGETVRRSPQRAAFTWYVNEQPPQSPEPLAVPDGVTLDSSRSDERFPQ